MKINLFNIDDFVKENHCKQVYDSIFFDSSGQAREGGLFSYEIFGLNDDQRSKIFAYIELSNDGKTHYLHPLVFLVVSRLGSLKDVITGQKYAILDNRKIQVINNKDLSKFPQAETGLEFVYDNWEKIDWLSEEDEEEIDSIDKKSRLRFLKSLKKDEAFCTKWLVLPPFYREEAADGASLGDSINELYKSLISRTNSMKSGGRFSFFGEDSKFKIQMLLVQIYTESVKVAKGKNSLLNKSIIGKTIDYTASNVITSPQISSAESVEDIPVHFGYSQLPLPTLLSLFQPFFVSKIAEWFSRMVIPQIYAVASEIKKPVKSINMADYNTEAAEKIIKMFIKAPNERFKEIIAEYTDTNGDIVQLKIPFFEANSEADIKSGKYIKRFLTYADMLTIIATEVLDDKHVYITRYPVTNIKNIYPAKISITTTSKTRHILITLNPEEKWAEFRKYPYIKWEGNPDKKPDNYYNFLEVMVPGNQYIAAMGGDYDGDMMYFKPVFSKEANAECERKIYEKSNFISVSGKPIRGVSNIAKDATMSLYELTKEG